MKLPQIPATPNVSSSTLIELSVTPSPWRIGRTNV
ncbi:hypothetical protein SBADM41S_05018 [Streptomyces badius]